jgi:hypothetical protein
MRAARAQSRSQSVTSMRRPQVPIDYAPHIDSKLPWPGGTVNERQLGALGQRVVLHPRGSGSESQGHLGEQSQPGRVGEQFDDRQVPERPSRPAAARTARRHN